MDEMGARTLMERLSVTEQPPSRVDIPLARQRGARRLRRRRWAAGVAPLLAAAAVAVVVAGTGGLPRLTGSGDDRTGPVSSARWVPRHPLSPLAPYAAFGWLPKGDPQIVSSPVSTLAQLQLRIGSAARGQFMLTVWAPAACGPGPAEVRTALSRGHHPTLDCRDIFDNGWAAQLSRPAPAIAGRPGFWFDGHELAWEYAPHAWATLVVYRRGAAIPDATMVKVAAHVKYAATGKPSVKFPFQLTGLPASWRVLSAPWRATPDGLAATADSHAMGGYPAVGPADGRSAGTIPQIEIVPGKSRCQFFRGSSLSRWAVLNGVRAVVTHFTGSGAPPDQGLCIPETHGLHVSFVEVPGPGRARFAFGGVTGVFLHHLRLLGPDPANWTTHPLDP
jgi:hypothetical protein